MFLLFALKIGVDLKYFIQKKRIGCGTERDIALTGSQGVRGYNF